MRLLPPRTPQKPWWPNRWHRTFLNHFERSNFFFFFSLLALYSFSQKSHQLSPAPGKCQGFVAASACPQLSRIRGLRNLSQQGSWWHNWVRWPMREPLHKMNPPWKPRPILPHTTPFQWPNFPKWFPSRSFFSCWTSLLSSPFYRENNEEPGFQFCNLYDCGDDIFLLCLHNEIGQMPSKGPFSWKALGHCLISGRCSWSSCLNTTACCF